jgi:hypothetical protein
MDIHDELDDPTDDIDEATYRDRAASKLDQIARQAKQALADQDIDIALFFLVPNSGDAILAYGTPGDPPDDEWQNVSAIVSSIVRQAVGLDRVRCQRVMCATTDSIADQPSQPTVKPTGQPGCCSMPMHAPALQHTGAEQ